jgi:hypothetical protein
VYPLLVAVEQTPNARNHLATLQYREIEVRIVERLV